MGAEGVWACRRRGFGHAWRPVRTFYLQQWAVRDGGVGSDGGGGGRGFGGGKASRKNTFGISLTPPRGRRIVLSSSH